MTHITSFFKALLQFLGLVFFLATTFFISQHIEVKNIESEITVSSDEYESIVNIDEAPLTTYQLELIANGTVKLSSYIDIVPEVSGKIIKVNDHFHTGGSFGKEEVLFEILPSPYEYNVEQAKADVARSKTQFELQSAQSRAAIAEWNLINVREPPPLVAKKPQLEEASAKMKAAEAALKKAQEDLNSTKYALPFSGRIMETSLSLGQYVNAGQPYGSIYAQNALEVDIPLRSDQLKWIVGAHNPQIIVHTDFMGENNNYNARLKTISAQAEQKSRLIHIFLEITDKDEFIIPGLFVNVTMKGAEIKDVWVLPLQAVQDDGFIWIVDEDNRARSHKPDIIYMDDEHVIIRGDKKTIRVISQHIQDITEGTKVRGK